MYDHARNAPHGCTHAGISQLARRYEDHDLRPSYRDGEIIEVIRVCTSAAWMVTTLVTRHLGLTEDAKKAGELFEEWGKHENPGLRRKRSHVRQRAREKPQQEKH